MRTRHKLVAILLCSILAGCTQDFNPNGPFEDKLVVYSILSTRDPYALVKVSNTYTIQGYDPFAQTNEPVVQGAGVSLRIGNTTTVLHDTIIVRTDKSRYSTDISAYVAFPFTLQRGGFYTLNVDANGKHANSTVQIPGSPTFTFSNSFLLTNPSRYYKSKLQLQTYTPFPPFASMMRAFLEYTIETPNGTETFLREIPSNVYADGTESGKIYIYPVFRKTGLGQGLNEPGYEMSFYVDERDRIYAENPDTMIRFLNLIFIFTQIDENLYNYYNIVNEFHDKKSIRLDEPDFNNITGGVGLFATFTEDTLKIPLLSPPW